MLQQVIVGLIVGLAALYALWRFMPAAWRRSAAAGLASGTHRAGLVDADSARKLQARLGQASGCGACDSCGGCASGKTPTQEAGR